MEKRLIPAVLISLTMALRIPFSNWQFCNKVILNVPSNTPLSRCLWLVFHTIKDNEYEVLHRTYVMIEF